MKIIRIRERGGNELHEYKRALKKLKEAQDAIDTICDLTEEMEDEFSERRYDPNRMDMRYREDGYHERDGYYGREWDDMHERRMRSRNGQYR